MPGFGHCAAGADAASVSPLLGYDRSPDAPLDATTWPAAPISSERLQSLPVQMIMVRTDGSRAVTEQVKTALVTDFPLHGSPAVVAEHRADAEAAKLLVGYKQLANVVILVSMCIAGCSLAVSVVGGLNDRKRPFSLLRLTGVQLGTLRRVVVLETAVPLLVIAAVAIGSGFLAAELFLKSQLDYTLRPPGAAYYLAVLAGLAASLGVIASTLPLLKRITGPETARNE
jgi:predicted lysophospholipase L1 biosynthesis ABC-type transport system permease subunit